MNKLDKKQALFEAIDRSDLRWREKRQIKFAYNWLPRRRAEIEQIIQERCVARGVVNSRGEIQGATDWEDILQIIKELLPIILELISLFG